VEKQKTRRFVTGRTKEQIFYLYSLKSQKMSRWPFATAIAPQMHPIVMARMKNFNYFRNANGLKYSSHLHHNFVLKREVYDDKKIT
jgi:hypothetical protein